MIKKQYSKLIIVSWIVLFICFGLKLFGGNLFVIICEQKNFINFCDWLDKNIFFKYLVSTITYVISTYLIYLSLTKQRIFKDWLIIILMLPNSVFKGYLPIIGWIIDIIVMLIIPIIRLGFKNWKNWVRVIVGIILIFIFQAISLFIRDIGTLYLPNNSMLVGLIISIDYYIMIVLYYLYSNRKEID